MSLSGARSALQHNDKVRGSMDPHLANMNDAFLHIVDGLTKMDHDLDILHSKLDLVVRYVKDRQEESKPLLR